MSDHNHIRWIILISGYVGLLQGIQRFVLPLALIYYGWSINDYGAVYLFQAISMALPFILGGLTTDLRGRKETIYIGFSFFIIGTVLMARYISGSYLVLIIIAQMFTTLSQGISQIGLSTMMIDETEIGQERTENLGKSYALQNFFGLVGPVFVGFLISGVAIKSFVIKLNFNILGYPVYESSFLLLTILGILGYFGIHKLPKTTKEFLKQNKNAKFSDFTQEQKAMQKSFLLEEILIGVLSGAIVPFIDYYIISTFKPSDFVWGIVFGISNSSIALGNYFVGKYAEKLGKGKTVLLIDMFAPLWALGIALAPALFSVSIFYIFRAGFANAIQPAWQSWYFSFTLDTARGRSFSAIQISRRLARATGVGIGPYLFALFGAYSFPLMCLFYPLAMSIPYITENNLPVVKDIYPIYMPNQ